MWLVFIVGVNMVKLKVDKVILIKKGVGEGLNILNLWIKERDVLWWIYLESGLKVIGGNYVGLIGWLIGWIVIKIKWLN